MIRSSLKKDLLFHLYIFNRMSFQIAPNTPIYKCFVLMAVFFFSCREDKKPDSFLLHPDFEIELVASEPLIFDPVDLEFDENGDAYVLQMPGYPKGIDESSIVKLIDQDEDGIYDQKIIYAENLAQASSIMPYKKGFLVAAPPDLLYLLDTDGDGKADQRQVLMSGYSDGNLQHNFNGLTYGLDHWIYLANGGNGGTAHWTEMPDSVLRIGGSDFRIKPDKLLFEITGRSSGGFELAMDEWGHIFGTHNLHHISTLVFPDLYIDGLNLTPRHTLLNISDHEENGLARVYPIGEQETRVNHPEQSGYFSGACGITYYGGGVFSGEFAGNIFVNDVVLNLVHRDVVQPEGVSHSAARGRPGTDFLASSDRSFRPVNSAVGPDGALYIVDMYRAVIEHPEWIPDELEVKMDLDAGKDKGRIYRITEKGRSLFTWQKPVDLEATVNLLTHPNQWQRLTAQRLIAENRDVGLRDRLLEEFNRSKDARTRIHILYNLRELEADLQGLLLTCLNDPVPQVRQHGLRLSESYLPGNPDLLKKVLNMTVDKDPGVQMQTALTLSTLDSTFSSVVIEAIRPMVKAEINNPYMRMAWMAACKYDPLRFARILNDEGVLSMEGATALVEMLATRLAQVGTTKGQQDLVLTFSGRDPHHTNLVAASLHSLSIAGLRLNSEQQSSGWAKFLNRLESERDLPVIRASWKLRNSLGLPPPVSSESIVSLALSNIRKSGVTEAQVVESLHLLAYAEADTVISEILTYVDARRPIKIQQAALDVLLGYNDVKVVARLVENWSGLSPSLRKRVTDALIYNADNHEILFASLENGDLNMSEFNFNLERRRRLLNSRDEKTRNRAATLFSDAGVVQRKDAIDKMRPALSIVGNTVAGKNIFEIQCATCHRFGNMGQNVGPDLSEISRKSKETLLHDILDPNAASDPEFINHIVDMNDGQVYSGIVEDETDDAIFIKMMGGAEITLAKNQIKNLQSTGLSLMPEGLEGNINVSEMADLLAFLQQSNL